MGTFCCAWNSPPSTKLTHGLNAQGFWANELIELQRTVNKKAAAFERLSCTFNSITGTIRPVDQMDSLRAELLLSALSGHYVSSLNK